MTAASTASSIICNVTLMVDFFRTKDFRRHGSGPSAPIPLPLTPAGLTEKQRQLVIAVMALLIYIALGSLVQRYLTGISFEVRRMGLANADRQDALYFVIVSVTTGTVRRAKA